MTFRINGALIAVFAITFLCSLDASAKADTGAGDGKDQAVSASHRAHAKGRLHKYTKAAQSREPSQRPYAWGGPPRQDPRDAYHGYFANPVDDPRYYGAGRTTLIFR